MGWYFGWKPCDFLILLVFDLECQWLLLFSDNQIIHVVFRSWEFRWRLCELLLLLVYLGTCIDKSFKHRRYVVAQGFHIRVMFFSHGFDVILNIDRWGRIGRRENRRCFIGGCRYWACVRGERHCEEYILVSFFGWFVDNWLVIEYSTHESAELMILYPRT